MVTLGLIRHGVTKWNQEGRTQGGVDIPLSTEGIEMAEQLASRLMKEQWQMIYTSPLQRATKTAKIIAAKQLNAEVIIDDRIREIGEGKKEGTTEVERLEKWGKSWRETSLGCEQDEFVVKRILSFVNDMKDHHLHQHILVVSHGSFIERMLEILCPTTELPTEIQNASLTIIEVSDQNTCIMKNCVKHLKV